MTKLTTDQVKNNVVIPALKVISDFSGDPGDFTFGQVPAASRTIFLENIKANLNAQPYVVDGQTNDDWMYDIPLNSDLFNQWANVNACIAYITQHQAVTPRTTPRPNTGASPSPQ